MVGRVECQFLNLNTRDDEKIFNNQTNEYETKKVDGGTISKEYITSEDGSKKETIYEKIKNQKAGVENGI